MSFSRARPIGWTPNDPLASAEINAIDIDHANAVDGDAGGTYGADLTWDGAHTFTQSPTLAGTTVWPAFGATRTIWRRIPAAIITASGGSPSSACGSVQFNSAGNDLALDLDPILPAGAQIVALAAKLTPTPGHSQTPAVMPVLSLEYADGTTLISTALTSKTDDSAPAGSSSGPDIAAYEATHVVTLTLGTPEAAFDPSAFVRNYQCRLYNESGTGSLGFLVATFAIGFELTALRI